MRQVVVLLVFIVGASLMMLLPLVVSVSFDRGITGEPTRVPAWLTVLVYYGVFGAILLFTCTELVRCVRRLSGNESFLDRTVQIEQDAIVPLLEFSGPTKGHITVRLTAVESAAPVRFVAQVVVSGEEESPLGEIVYDEGHSVECVAGCVETRNAAALELRIGLVEHASRGVAPVRAQVRIELRGLAAS